MKRRIAENPDDWRDALREFLRSAGVFDPAEIERFEKLAEEHPEYRLVAGKLIKSPEMTEDFAL